MTASGSLLTFLGIAPGVGKTYDMLAEAHRREATGERVVVGWIERHGRADTRAQLGDLEVIPPRTVVYGGGTFDELDVQSVIESGAELVLVDELAHSIPGTRRKRCEDVRDLLTAGLDVMTTTNVANLESVRDFAARITGAGAVESVPDEFVRAGEVILIDMAADALRRRIASGSVYSAERVGGALAEYFRASNLTALSELGRAWMSGELEAVGNELLIRRGLIEPMTRPLVVAGVSASQGERVVRAAAELAREDDADLVAVYVNVTDGLSLRQSQELERTRGLTVELGGIFREVEGGDPARTLAEIARKRSAVRVVVGQHRPRLIRPSRWSVATRLSRLVPDVAVNVVSDSSA